ncbi:MAG: hypothetical protein WC269_01965 [Candidatus Gracilibacteria bacterium]
MENKKINHEDHECCGSCCGSHHGHGMHRAFWIIIRVLIILLVLWAVFGFFFGHMWNYGRFGYDKFGYNGMGYNMMNGGYNMMGWYDDDDSGSRNGLSFGTITKIDGNKITVLNNANAEVTFATGASTVIYSSTGEIGLAGLKVGQNINYYGKTDKNTGNFTLRMIRVL